MSTSSELPRGILRKLEVPPDVQSFLSLDDQKILRRTFDQLRLIVVLRKLSHSRFTLAELYSNRRILQKSFTHWLRHVRVSRDIKKICTAVRHCNFSTLEDFMNYFEHSHLDEIIDMEILHTIFSLNFLRRKLLKKCFLRWKNENLEKLLSF